MEDVAGAPDAAVTDVGLVPGSSAAELVVERNGRTLTSAVGIAGSANAAEESAGRAWRGLGTSSAWRKEVGSRGGRSGLGGGLGTDVACTTTTRADVGVVG